MENELLLTSKEYMKLVKYIPLPSHDLRKVAEAQLTKAKQHYHPSIKAQALQVKIAKEQGRQEVLQKGLDREPVRARDRERQDELREMESVIYRALTTRITMILPEGTTLLKFSEQLAKELSTLIPDIEVEREKVAEIVKGLLTPEEAQKGIEEVKREEREKVMDKIKTTFSDTITKGAMTATNAWQTLKEEK